MAGENMPRHLAAGLETTTLDRLYLEWSQFTGARTARERELGARVAQLEDAFTERGRSGREQELVSALSTVTTVLDGGTLDGWPWWRHLLWVPHDLVGHPVSRLLYLCGASGWAAWVHDVTMPGDG